MTGMMTRGLGNLIFIGCCGVAAAGQRFSLFLHRGGRLTFNTAVFRAKKIWVKFCLQSEGSLPLNVAVVLLPKVPLNSQLDPDNPQMLRIK